MGEILYNISDINLWITLVVVVHSPSSIEAWGIEGIQFFRSDSFFHLIIEEIRSSNL